MNAYFTQTRLAALASFAMMLYLGTGCFFGGKKAADPPATAAAAAATGAERYKVTAATTPFYLYGPQQANGPDESLKKETRVTMVKRAYGYSRITTPDGKTGYVGTEDLAQLSPAEIADENAAQLQLQVPMPSAEEQKRMSAMGGYTIPPEAGNDERLPLADPSPTPKPSPSTPFHF